MKYSFDLHTHTLASGHAYSTLEEMIAAAKRNELICLGVSDHAPGLPGSPYIYHFQNLKVVPREIDGLKMMMGVEANIIDYDGGIDMSPENLQGLDYVIASLHPPCIEAGNIIQNTSSVIGAIMNPWVNIIGHPDDSRFECDYEEVVKAAKENHVLLEINNASLNPNGFRKDAWANSKKILSWCMKYEHPVILGSDAHISYDVGNFEYCLKLIAEIGFPDSLIVNTDISKVQKLIEAKRQK